MFKPCQKHPEAMGHHRLSHPWFGNGLVAASSRPSLPILPLLSSGSIRPNQLPRHWQVRAMPLLQMFFHSHSSAPAVPQPPGSGSMGNSELGIPSAVLARFVLDHLAYLPPTRELLRNEPLPPMDVENLIVRRYSQRRLRSSGDFTVLYAETAWNTLCHTTSATYTCTATFPPPPCSFLYPILNPFPLLLST